MTMSLRTCLSVLLLLLLAAAVSLADDKGKNVRVDIRDACDPATFDAAVGPGTCAPDHSGGRITFDEFIAELQEAQSVGAWRFNPNALTSERNLTVTLRNKGGEAHSFTHVQQFGGGFVDVLNQLSGNPNPTPECLQLANELANGLPQSTDNQLVPAGAIVDGPTISEGEFARFQCCIHPWMRLTVGPEHNH